MRLSEDYTRKDEWVYQYDNQEQWSRIRAKVSIKMNFWIEALALN